MKLPPPNTTIAVRTPSGRAMVFEPPATPAEAPPVSTAYDVMRSAGTGVRSGLEGLSGLSGDTAWLYRWLHNKAREGLGYESDPSYVSGQGDYWGKSVFGELPTSADARSASTSFIGDPYKPQTTAGEYVKTVGEFLPASMLGPGSVVRKATVFGLAPAITSEYLGQETKGTAAEPYARVAGALAGPFVPGAWSHMLNRVAPTAEEGARTLRAFPGPVEKTAPATSAAAAEETPRIRAYHGSPHDFDSFDMAKIGTGEGAQNYGHGLYFAEHPDVAEMYKKQLAAPTVNGRAFDAHDPLHIAANEVYESGGDTRAATASLETQYNLAYDMGLSDKEKRVIGEAKKLIESGYAIPPLEYKGRMYEVYINASPENFLDFDAPIRDQSQAVRDALAKTSWGDAYVNSSLTGGQVVPQTPGGAAQLRKAGIPGIKYLDQGSRNAGEGTRNYVVFDDKLISIVRKYGIAGALGMGAITADQAAQMRQVGYE